MSGPATPHTALPSRASQPPTGSATPALPPQPAVPAMPPPADFDILPDLHKLLTRLIGPPSLPASTPGQPSKDKDGPLEMHQLASEATVVKRKMQRARDKVLALPDIDRTIEDQLEEIEDLEATIARLKTALLRMGQPSNKTMDADDADTKMTG